MPRGRNGQQDAGDQFRRADTVRTVVRERLRKCGQTDASKPGTNRAEDLHRFLGAGELERK